jgi:hypothetical protein
MYEEESFVLTMICCLHFPFFCRGRWCWGLRTWVQQEVGLTPSNLKIKSRRAGGSCSWDLIWCWTSVVFAPINKCFPLGRFENSKWMQLSSKEANPCLFWFTLPCPSDNYFIRIQTMYQTNSKPSLNLCENTNSEGRKKTLKSPLIRRIV